VYATILNKEKFFKNKGKGVTRRVLLNPKTYLPYYAPKTGEEDQTEVIASAQEVSEAPTTKAMTTVETAEEHGFAGGETIPQDLKQAFFSEKERPHLKTAYDVIGFTLDNCIV
jgi:hypothetical protein